MTTQYDSSGDLIGSWDPDGHQRRYSNGAGYAGSGPVSITNALNQTTNYTYDADTGLLTSVADSNGVKTTYSYDQMLRTTQIETVDSSSNLAGLTAFTYSLPSGARTSVQMRASTPRPVFLGAAVQPQDRP